MYNNDIKNTPAVYNNSVFYDSNLKQTFDP